ncbi:uncharacterized protein LOC122290915 [Carya illinoinensis]|uniref:uncharacterized protein LOC122290915 n=1 Tax=Carya illinoinensis TaxID=32201 RepID=UPI001C71E711|nr:uncharacterized protein LOC122290915 [Carya illinoinensis]
MQEVDYLGHIISGSGVKADPSKLESMVEWPIPKSLKGLRGIVSIGLEAFQAFQKLKEAVTNPPVLQLPDFSKSLTIECDASGIGLGAVFMQEETQQKWLSKLIGYDFTIDYKRGKENKAANALSRKSEEQSATVALITFPTSMRIEELKQSYQLCPFTMDIYEKLQQGYEGPKHLRLAIKEGEDCGAGLLQPLPVPSSPWVEISMNFIEGLPSSGGYTIEIQSLLVISGMSCLDCKALHSVSLLLTAYHPQSNGQTEALNKVVEAYLRCYTSDKPKEWSSWLPLAEWCYNTNHHSSIKICHFEALYGYLPPRLVSYVAGTSINLAVDQQLRSREQLWLMLRKNLLQSQNKMKEFADRRRIEREFQILERIGTVAYRLELPPSTNIHPVIHVSCLKKKLGQNVIPLPTLPPADSQGQVQPEPELILQKKDEENQKPCYH